MNENTTNIIVKDYINKTQAITTADAEIIFKVISSIFDKSENVKLDFSNLNLVLSCFLNRAVGDLYGKYSNDFIKEHLSFSNVTDSDAIILKNVVDRAKDYYKDEDKAKERLKEAFNDD